MKEDVKNYCREIKALKKALKGKAKDSPCESKKKLEESSSWEKMSRKRRRKRT